MQTIIIWDEDYKRIKTMERNLQNAMQQEKIIARIQLNVEPPLIARHNLLGKTPVVQVDDSDFWSITPGKTISTQSFQELLILLRKNQILQ